ncbi:MAG: glycosyltransferase [Lachnospiraceae bacterium]|nr:glycosyltransferase [Lachnospiraceae bacterium]MBQ8947927.1 glycosyltransferase [Lachnospiraceae bacterium]
MNRYLNYLKRNGISDTYYAVKERLKLRRGPAYSYVSPGAAELERQRGESEGLQERPLIGVVMPAYNTPAGFLREAVDSVVRQSYPDWRLVISDASDQDCVERIAGEYSGDPRIIYLKLNENRGISANTNEGVTEALKSVNGRACDYIALLDHDDVLTPDALYHMAMAIMDPDQKNRPRDPDQKNRLRDPDQKPALLYSDEDKMTADEASGSVMYFDDHIKYKFNYDLILSNNYICHLMLIRRDIAAKIRFRSEYDGAQDYDLVLSTIRLLCGHGDEPVSDPIPVTELDNQIVHVTRVLYHWRSHAGSTATNTASKYYAYEAGREALREHIRVMYGENAGDVRHSRHLGFYNIVWGQSSAGDTGQAKPERSGSAVAASDRQKSGNPSKEDIDTYISGIFAIRSDIGAVAVRVFDRHGRMSECIADENGNWLYSGTFKHYAGRFNRFDCAQDVAFADIRYIRVRPELMDLHREYMDRIRETGDHVSISREFAEKIKENGYMIMYIPV